MDGEKRKDVRGGVEYCIHNMQKEYCSFCTGDYSRRKEQEMARLSVVDGEEIKLRERYAIEKGAFSRFGELWMDEEVAYVKDVFNDIDTRGADWRKLILQVSLILERTKGSISWMYELLFRPESSLVRGRVALKYME